MSKFQITQISNSKMERKSTINVFYVIKNILDREEQQVMEKRLMLRPSLLLKIIECCTNEEIPKLHNYYEAVIPQMNMSTFKSHFRMSRVQFVIIMDQIGGSIAFEKKNQNEQGGREQVSPEKALLITLWTLATPDSYRSVAERFGIVKSTVHNVISTVINVILNELCHKYIHWPTEYEKHDIAQEFSHFSLTHCIGAIDGCHIPIQRPSVDGVDYFNRKKYYSLVLQGVCMHNLLFSDVDVRWPGSVHDSRVLRTSPLYPRATELCQPNYYIVGDAAYPCKSWLLPPFRNNGHLTGPQLFYNEQLSKTRVVIENAFALLKGRFRRLKDMLVRVHMQDYVNTIVACCVLHNICILHDADDLLEYIQEDQDEQNIRMVAGHEDEHDALGHIVRNNVVNELWHRRNQH